MREKKPHSSPPPIRKGYDGLTGGGEGKTTAVAKVLVHRPGHYHGRAREQHSPKSQHLLGRWRWKLATCLLLVLSVHALTANFILPLLSEQLQLELGDGSGLRVSVRIEHVVEDLLDGGDDDSRSEAGLQGATSLQEATRLQRVPSHWGPSGSGLHRRGRPLTQTGGATTAAGPGGEATAVAWGNGSDPWSPVRRALIQRQQEQDAQLRPSSIAEWLCGEGSQELLREQAKAYRFDLVMKSKTYLKTFGKRVAPAKRCRGEVPWLVPQLRRVVRLESGRPRSARGITLATQLSLERLGMLENQCRMWPHQISAVLYVPLILGRIFSIETTWNGSSLDVGIAQVLRFHAAMEAQGSCMLDLELVTEERCSSEVALLYPVNAVRNRALLNVKTEAVLLLDVDFAVSHSLAAVLGDSQQYMQLMWALQQRYAMVLPAFEMADRGDAGRLLALQAVAQGKSFVAEKFSWGAMAGFHSTHYPQGHGPTDFKRWMYSSHMYNVTYKQGFEPYILMATRHVPWYDERFRGYYWNKVQQLMHIARQLKFQFAVHPSAFVVHLPHPKPSSRMMTAQSGQKELNYKLLQHALWEMQAGRFVPVTSFPQDCIGSSLLSTA